MFWLPGFGHFQWRISRRFVGWILGIYWYSYLDFVWTVKPKKLNQSDRNRSDVSFESCRTNMLVGQKLPLDLPTGKRTQHNDIEKMNSISHKFKIKIDSRTNIKNTMQVQLIRYNPDKVDESVLWTQSKEFGEGYRAIRMVNNIHLNVDAFHGDDYSGGVHDGTHIVLWKWKEGENQLWKIVPYCKCLLLFPSILFCQINCGCILFAVCDSWSGYLTPNWESDCSC